MIADTGNGLRILTTDHVWDDKQPQPAVESIRQDVDRALTKLAAPLRAVVAVPPFVCDDFTFGYSLLKGAYAEMLIQTLDGVPGIQTVEIAEARAIAAERGLAGDDALRRPLLPYFLLGAYRNEGEGDGRRVGVVYAVPRQIPIARQKVTPPRIRVVDDRDGRVVVGHFRVAAARGVAIGRQIVVVKPLHDVDQSPVARGGTLGAEIRLIRLGSLYSSQTRLKK